MKMPVWGAAYLGLIVLSFVPFVNFITGPLSLALTIYLCVSGHRLAWQNRRFADGFPEYLAVQRAWFKWGLGVFVVGMLLVPILAAILFPVFARARMNREDAERLLQPALQQRRQPRPSRSRRSMKNKGEPDGPF